MAVGIAAGRPLQRGERLELAADTLVVALSEEATCENKDERPSEMSWYVLQRSALSSAMSWGFEYFKNNYVPTEYKEELAKQAFAQTVIREDNARQAARRAKRKGGTRE